jgi:iron complex outermembrane receptor protein
MKRLFFLSAVIGFGLVLWATPQVYAQEVDAFMLEEITVTAQKREESQQKVAITMDTVSGEDIRQTGGNDLEDIISNLSGVYINKAGDGMRVSIRGMSDDVSPTGTLQNMSNSTPSVAVNTDGVFSSRRASGSALYDLERVEVLYGPQSTLYASNSPGGIVNIVTADPKLDLYQASGTVEYGSYEMLHTEGSLNVPVSGSVAMRAAFNTSVRDGYMENGSDDEDTKSGRLKLLYQPADALSMVLTGEVTKSGGSGYSGIDMFIDEGDLDDPWDNSDEDAPIPRRSDDKSSPPVSTGASGSAI